jgi:hypothetical protein
MTQLRSAWNLGGPMKDRFTIILVVIGLGILAYAVLAPREDKSGHVEKQKQAIDSVSDPDVILPKALKALDEQVRVQEGFIVVTEARDLDTYLLPLQSPWMLRCGVGLSIQLGSVASGSDGSVGSQIDLWLTTDMIEKTACSALVPKIGARMQEKLTGK